MFAFRRQTVFFSLLCDTNFVVYRLSGFLAGSFFKVLKLEIADCV